MNAPLWLLPEPSPFLPSLPGCSTLSKCCHAMVAVIYPFTWQHTYIPVLPPAMVDIVCSPTPFLIGLLTSSLPLLRELPLEEVSPGDVPRALPGGRGQRRGVGRLCLRGGTPRLCQLAPHCLPPPIHTDLSRPSATTDCFPSKGTYWPEYLWRGAAVASLTRF